MRAQSSVFLQSSTASSPPFSGGFVHAEDQDSLVSYSRRIGCPTFMRFRWIGPRGSLWFDGRMRSRFRPLLEEWQVVLEAEWKASLSQKLDVELAPWGG